MTANRTLSAYAKLSPREKRQAEPRWSYRCEVCKNEWHATGYLTTQYCCGEYATEIDALDAEED